MTLRAMKRAYATLALGLMVLLSLIGCAREAEMPPRESEPTRPQEEYAPMEYILGDDWGRADGNASNLRFQLLTGRLRSVTDWTS